MPEESYDIITIGGGLGGASLAKAMAERGARVLVLEQTRQFKDRVRGEFMAPWGVAEAEKLGIDEVLRRTCAHELRWLDFYAGPLKTEHRDLVATTVPRLPALAFYHPAMQEALLGAAADAGAEVHRGCPARGVTPGPTPSVLVEIDGSALQLRARLVVGAAGRGALVRKWGNFPVRRDPERLFIAGVLFEDMNVASDSVYWLINPSVGKEASLFPQGKGKVRAYLVYRKEAPFRLSGRADLPRFIEEAVSIGVPPDFYAGAKAAGPLATFDAHDTWVDHPYRDGVALIGDAAACSDPTWGQGLSLTVRDARMLRDHLLNHDDWDTAGHAYAGEHDRSYGTIHRVHDWLTDMFYETGPAGEVRRARAFPLISADDTRLPDHTASGPDLPADEEVKRRFFGEE